MDTEGSHSNIPSTSHAVSKETTPGSVHEVYPVYYEPRGEYQDACPPGFKRIQHRFSPVDFTDGRVNCFKFNWTRIVKEEDEYKVPKLPWTLREYFGFEDCMYGEDFGWLDTISRLRKLFGFCLKIDHDQNDATYKFRKEILVDFLRHDVSISCTIDRGFYGTEIMFKSQHPIYRRFVNSLRLKNVVERPKHLRPFLIQVGMLACPRLTVGQNWICNRNQKSVPNFGNGLQLNVHEFKKFFSDYKITNVKVIWRKQEKLYAFSTMYTPGLRIKKPWLRDEAASTIQGWWRHHYWGMMGIGFNRLKVKNADKVIKKPIIMLSGVAYTRDQLYAQKEIGKMVLMSKSYEAKRFKNEWCPCIAMNIHRRNECNHLCTRDSLDKNKAYCHTCSNNVHQFIRHGSEVEQDNVCVDMF